MCPQHAWLTQKLANFVHTEHYVHLPALRKGFELTTGEFKGLLLHPLSPALNRIYKAVVILQ